MYINMNVYEFESCFPVKPQKGLIILESAHSSLGGSFWSPVDCGQFIVKQQSIFILKSRPLSLASIKISINDSLQSLPFPYFSSC